MMTNKPPGEAFGKMKPPNLNLQAPDKSGAFFTTPSPCPSSDADEGGVSLKRSPVENGPVTGHSLASTNIVGGSATNSSSAPDTLVTGSNAATSSTSASPANDSPDAEPYNAGQDGCFAQQPQQSPEVHYGPIQNPGDRGAYNPRGSNPGWRGPLRGPNLPMSPTYPSQNFNNARRGFRGNARGGCSFGPNGRGGAYDKQQHCPNGRQQFQGPPPYPRHQPQEQLHGHQHLNNNYEHSQHGQVDPCQQYQDYSSDYSSAPLQPTNMNNSHFSPAAPGYQTPTESLPASGHTPHQAVAPRPSVFPINSGGPHTFPDNKTYGSNNRSVTRQCQQRGPQLPKTPEKRNLSNSQWNPARSAQKPTFPIVPERPAGDDAGDNYADNNGNNGNSTSWPSSVSNTSSGGTPGSSRPPPGYRAGLPGSASDGSLMNPMAAQYQPHHSSSSSVHMPRAMPHHQQQQQHQQQQDQHYEHQNQHQNQHQYQHYQEQQQHQPTILETVTPAPNVNDGSPGNNHNKNNNIVVSGSNNINNNVNSSSNPITTTTLQHPLQKCQVWEPPTREVIAGRSEELNRLVDPSTGRPHASLLLDPEFIPFEETLKRGKRCYTDSVCVIRNAPYDVRVADVTSILPKTLRLASKDASIHITMDRNMGKTMDIYVELSGPDAAVAMKDHVDSAWLQSRPVRVGDRVVDVDVSSQSGLMRALFPRAACEWGYDAEPVFAAREEEREKQEEEEEEEEEGGGGGGGGRSKIKVAAIEWKGFVMEEELTMLVKFAEAPGRSAFAKNSPERPYECLLSTLVRLPWQHSDRITIHQRHYIYRATRDCLRCLDEALEKTTTAPFASSSYNNNNNNNNPNNNPNPTRLTRRLRQRLVTAAMLCPGFTVHQKEELGLACGMTRHQTMTEYGLPLHGGLWRHQYTISPKMKVPVDVTEYYIALIREETNRAVEALPIRDKTRIFEAQGGGLGTRPGQYWGNFWREIGFPVAGKKFDDLTLAEAHELEMGAVDRILRRALERGGSGDVNVNSTATAAAAAAAASDPRG